MQSKWVIRNIENIVITELKIRFLPPDLTLVQSEMVVLGVLGYSRTQHAGFDDEGILSVSGHRHLGELKRLDQDNLSHYMREKKENSSLLVFKATKFKLLQLYMD